MQVFVISCEVLQIAWLRELQLTTAGKVGVIVSLNNKR